MSIEALLPLLLLFPLVGALINGTIGKYLPKVVSGTIGTLAAAIPFVIALTIFFQLGDEPVRSVLFNVIDLNSLHLDASLYADNLSLWMTLIVTGVGSLIHLYSIGYMKEDKCFHKFFAYLNLFIFSMLILVLGSNYFMLYFGWEGVGVCSYLLISFNYDDEEKGLLNSRAGRKSFIMNRVGDLALLIAFFLILSSYGTLEYSELSKIVLSGDIMPASIVIFGITLSLFIGATGKSAQIPLFTWLPDAMAGPTPVSALIHAATMVTAGIFLIIRSNFLFELAPVTQDIVLWIGLLTALVAGFIALRQNDIKKVLAYSTVSQLGFIFVALGLGAYTTAMFHVTTHAFFKALLFLGAGSIIHAMSGEQDMRKMGGLKNKIKITHITFLIATLAISGFPFFSGFYSKDAILEHTFEHGMLVYVLLLIAAAFTAIYMFRLYYVVFHGSFRDSKEVENHIHESPANMTIPLIVLAVLALIGGIINLPGMFLSKGTHYLSHLLEANVAGLDQIEHAVPHLSTAITLTVIASAVCIVILIISDIIYRKKGVVPAADENKLTGWQRLSNRKLYWDEIYDFLFVVPMEKLSVVFHKIGDKLILEGIVDGIAGWVVGFGELTRKWQTGRINSYVLWMVVGIIGFITYYLIKI